MLDCPPSTKCPRHSYLLFGYPVRCNLIDNLFSQKMFVSHGAERLCLFNPQSVLAFDMGKNTTCLSASLLMNSRARKNKAYLFSLPRRPLSGFLLCEKPAASNFTRVPHQYGMCWGISYCSISKTARTYHVNSAKSTEDKENFPTDLGV